MIDSTGEVNQASRTRPRWAWAFLVAFVSFGWFSSGIPAEPDFVDEWAYVSQSYYADLYLSGDWNDRQWLDYPAYDLPPLPKYTIGLALMGQGYQRPKRAAAVDWYLNTSSTSGPRAMLIAARWPSAAFGALGCVALFVLGSLVLGTRVGFVAAALLAINPLYAMLSRRAMADIPAEAFLLATEAVALGLLLRVERVGFLWFLGWLGVGVLGGFAVLSKLNGTLGLMTVCAWGVVGLSVLDVAPASKIRLLSMTLVAGLIGFATFLVGNPFMTARPSGPLSQEDRQVADLNLWGRARRVAQHRIEVSAGAAKIFPHNALTTPAEKLKAMAVQGFGRFGPFGPAHTDSTKRFDWTQDWGAIPWGAVVALGAYILARRISDERTSGVPPWSLFIALQAAVSLTIVTAFLPLAWDRYFVSVQPSLALVGAIGICGLVGRLFGHSKSTSLFR